MKVYLVSDTHFNHANIATYCDRPADFTDRIIRNWKNTVKADDLVIHLGDVFIGKHEGWDAIYPLLPGRKVLVRGNHDKHSCPWYMTHGFDFACDAMEFRGAYLTHKPHTGIVLPEGCNINIHGHLHNVWHGFHPNNGIEESEEILMKSQKRLRNSWQRLFATEYTNYMPVEFSRFVDHPDRYQSRGPRASES